MGSSVTRGKRRGGNKANKKRQRGGKAGSRRKRQSERDVPESGPAAHVRCPSVTAGARCPLVPVGGRCPVPAAASGPVRSWLPHPEPSGAEGRTGLVQQLPKTPPALSPRLLSGEGDIFPPVARGWGGRWVACLFFSFFSSPSLFSFCLSPSARAAAGLGAERRGWVRSPGLI